MTLAARVLRDSAFEAFSVRVAEKDVHELLDRVRKARLPDPGPGGDGWDYGTPVKFARRMQEHWLGAFDWREQERRMNAMGSHFFVRLDGQAPLAGLRVHFVLAEPPAGARRQELPLLLLHGWPGSFFEFHEVVPRLTQAGFTVVVPSLLGYGFSDAPREPGFSVRVQALAMASLMKTLGFARFGAQGGDWGSEVCKWLGADASSGCVGLHLNMFTCGPPKEGPMPEFEPGDQERLARLDSFMREGVGYQKIQQTRPQSLGYALNDSPMGLACWIAEKFGAWADTGGSHDPCDAVSMDVLLANVCIYWFAQTITPSMRLYYETLGLGPERRRNPGRVPVPTCIAELPAEVFSPPMGWVRRAFKVTRHTVYPRGGHFAALEVPERLAEDIAIFFSSLPSKAKL